MISIQLNFINQSNDANNSQIVIFQKNAALPNNLQNVTAWQTFQIGAQGNSTLINYPIGYSVSASDSFGNVSPMLPASEGNRFDFVNSVSGSKLQLSAIPASAPQVIEVHNELSIGSIGANIYKDGKLLNAKMGISPGQMAQFAFTPTIYLTRNNQIVQGEEMNVTPLAADVTEISLMGLRSADIVMTGGGKGPDAQPFNFTLTNIKMV